MKSVKIGVENSVSKNRNPGLKRGMVVRLLSARQANKDERNLYLVHKFKNQEDESTDS